MQHRRPVPTGSGATVPGGTAGTPSKGTGLRSSALPAGTGRSQRARKPWRQKPRQAVAIIGPLQRTPRRRLAQVRAQRTRRLPDPKPLRFLPGRPAAPPARGRPLAARPPLAHSARRCGEAKGWPPQSRGQAKPHPHAFRRGIPATSSGVFITCTRGSLHDGPAVMRSSFICSLLGFSRGAVPRDAAAAVFHDVRQPTQGTAQPGLMSLPSTLSQLVRSNPLGFGRVMRTNGTHGD
jgi:hypothetical protein